MIGSLDDAARLEFSSTAGAQMPILYSSSLEAQGTPEESGR
jgi:hypothetical protein